MEKFNLEKVCYYAMIGTAGTVILFYATCVVYYLILAI